MAAPDRTILEFDGVRAWVEFTETQMVFRLEDTNAGASAVFSAKVGGSAHTTIASIAVFSRAIELCLLGVVQRQRAREELRQLSEKGPKGS